MTPRRRHTAAGLAAGLLAASAAGLLLLAPTLSSAAQSPERAVGQASTSTIDTDTIDTAPEGTGLADTGAAGTDTVTDVAADDDPDAASGGRLERLGELLQPLVDDGTLSEDQLDAVVAELDAAMPVIGRGAGHGMPGGPVMPGGPGQQAGPGRLIGLEGLDAAADVIGIEDADLREQLRDGATLAEIAIANGVEPQAVIDVLVAEATDRITRRVNGDLAEPVDTTED